MTDSLKSQQVVHVPVDHNAFGGHLPVLCCPVCGFHYVHPARVNIELGHVQVTATGDHALVAPSQQHERARGSAVTLAFFCESGHWFQYELRFEKGHTFVELKSAQLESTEGLPELWRN